MAASSSMIVASDLIAPSQGESESPRHDSDSGSEGGDTDTIEDSLWLGFVDQQSEYSFGRFPDKVGGKPVWLDPTHLPPEDHLACKKCGKPMILLLQIYAPIEDVEEAHHRELMLFCCRNGSCKCVRAFRAQLPRVNQYYIDDDDDDDDDDEVNSEEQGSKQGKENAVKSTITRARLCEVCGCLGTKNCSYCRAANYCSKDHQVVDWRLGHAEICKELQQLSLKHRDDTTSGDFYAQAKELYSKKYPSKFLFKEFRIATEPEPVEDPHGTKEKTEMMQKYDQYLNNWANRKNTDVDEESIDPAKEDKTFNKFQQRIAREPEQVMRYWHSTSSSPLWMSDKGQPATGDIAICAKCHAPRTFEFQVLPQLLYYLEVDKNNEDRAPLDWGTLAVYTCNNSCTLVQDGWAEEFVWLQEL